MNITVHKDTESLTVSKLRRESTAIAFASLSSLFMSRLYFVRHSVITTVNAVEQSNLQVSPYLCHVILHRKMKL